MDCLNLWKAQDRIIFLSKNKQTKQTNKSSLGCNGQTRAFLANRTSAAHASGVTEHQVAWTATLSKAVPCFKLEKKKKLFSNVMFYQAYHLGGIAMNAFHAVYSVCRSLTVTPADFFPSKSWRILPGSLYRTFHFRSYSELTYILSEATSCPQAKPKTAVLLSQTSSCC